MKTVPLRSSRLARGIRSHPHLYSAVCRARLFYSRHIAGRSERKAFRAYGPLFDLNSFEAAQVASLERFGFALLPDFFPASDMDRLFSHADFLFRKLQLDSSRSYSVQCGQRATLDGLSYEELAASEKMVALSEPLIAMPELFGFAFHETILKVAANFLKAIPPLYRVTLVRDFPHSRPLHSSNFHKDNDESDSLQIFIYLVDIDDQTGPLVYVPGSNHHDPRSCRPRLSRDLGLSGHDGRLSDDEVQRAYPRNTWAVLRTRQGGVAFVHGNGIHKGPAWMRPGDPHNRPRTAIRLDLHGHKAGTVRNGAENRMYRSDFGRLSPLQKLFAHPSFADEAAVLTAGKDRFGVTERCSVR
jgi:Phytanoyl-CoA dioxygenase (PhyH)